MSDMKLTDWKQRVEQAKLDILSPAGEAPGTLRAMAETQLAHAIEDVELLLLTEQITVHESGTILTHLRKVKEATLNESFSVIQHAWNSTYLTDSCERFLTYYTGILTARGVTVPSPA